MSIIDDVAAYLQSEGVGTVGTTIFKAYLPQDPDIDDVVLVRDTGGSEPDPYLPTKEPTFQIFIRASDYDVGRELLDDVRAALHQQRNVELVNGSTYFYFILAISEGGHIGRNENGKDEFAMNFRARVR